MISDVEPQNGADSMNETNDAGVFEANVTVSFKKPVPLDIELDIDSLTVEDIEFIEKLSADSVSTKELVKFLGRVVVDLDINKVPLRALPKITNALITAIGGASDPNS